MTKRLIVSGVLVSMAGATMACKSAEGTGSKAAPPASTEPTVSARQAADMMHAIMAADRTVYTKQVVNRLTKEQKVEVVDAATKQPAPLEASEQWKTEHGKLPLPAQMFRMGSELVAEKNLGFSYVLLSQWPVNKQNKPKTKLEEQGLAAVVANAGKEPFYGTEELGGKKFFTAVYADVAVAQACIDCHNDHPDSPRTDFKLNDVMGGVVIRIPQ